jgi:FlaA1/EpsC-like NDP-sugar epimerase
MAEIRIEISLENAAFEGTLMTHEVSRILHCAAHKILDSPNIEDQILRDVNGNKVGTLICIPF